MSPTFLKKNLLKYGPSGSGKESTAESSAGDARNLGSVPQRGRSPGGGKGNPLHILDWKLPWAGEPGRLQSTWSQRPGHTCVRTWMHQYIHG